MYDDIFNKCMVYASSKPLGGDDPISGKKKTTQMNSWVK